MPRDDAARAEDAREGIARAIDADARPRGGLDARKSRANASDGTNVWMRGERRDGALTRAHGAEDDETRARDVGRAFCVERARPGGREPMRWRALDAARDLGLRDACEVATFVDDDACVVFTEAGDGAYVRDVYSPTMRATAIETAYVEVKGARARATRCAATETTSGTARAVVGDSNGNLYAVESDGKDGVTWKVFDRTNTSHWVDDMHDEEEEEGNGGSAPGSPMKTPGKSRAWGAIRSATMAAGALLSRRVNVGGVRSLSFVDGSTETKRRLLVCVADGKLEEWSLDVSVSEKSPTLAHVHKLGKKIQKSLRVYSNIVFVSADWTLTKAGVDITVLVECDGRGSLHRFQRAHGTDTMNLIASAVPPAGALPNNFLHAKVVVDGEDTFVLAGDGSAVMFSGVDYSRVSARMDASNHEPIIDIKRVGTGEWLILTKESGCSTFKPHASGRQTTPRRSAKETPKRTTRSSSHVTSPSANPVDDTNASECVRVEFENYFAGQSGPLGQTKSRLRASGAFVSDAAPFATMSKGLVDALPKKLSGKSTRGGGPTIEEHGAEKLNRHLLFLDFLTESGAWSEINAEERSEILMHGEMIAALSQLRGLQHTVDDEMKPMLEEIVTHAGAAIKETDSALDERSDVEVCFSRSSEARLMFPAVVYVLEKNLAKNKALEKRAITLDTCARGLLVALEAANDFRRRRTGLYPPFSSSVGVNWTCEIEAREALRALSKTAITLYKEAALSKTHVGLAPVLGSRLMASAAPLLDASAANLNAALPSSTDRIEAHDEYVADRALVLPTLLECATHSTTVPQQDRPQRGSLTEGVDVSVESVAAVAEAHFGYAELFEICDAPNATGRLHHYMRTLLGAQEDGEETFAHFVYRKLAIVQDRAAALLRDLPVEFHGDLERFLSSHPDLRWLMELRMGKYARASETLASIGNRAGTAEDEKRRMLSMAKLAALAAGGDVEERIESIDASLSA